MIDIQTTNHINENVGINSTMIKFVDLKTGNLFSGFNPYIHWFDNEQSTGIIYNQSLCFVSKSQTHNITIETNNVFDLININNLSNNLEVVNDFQYYNIENLKTKKVTSVGCKYSSDVYVHLIYITASTDIEGEYIANFYIDGIECKIGADFYSENESLKINLFNRGVELPCEIQKAVYDVNLHEDKIDNIVINRKWKELLSNYWDIIANKGSYMSLYNSLKWFEYGDLVKICEVWKSQNDKYNIRDIQSVLSDKYYGTLDSFSKTTYFALYCALEKPVTENGNYVYGEDGNPILQNISSKWSTIDLSLKMCLLGNFYETYFMPIHTELIHSTIEDIVYTDTMKLTCGAINERRDYIDNIKGVNLKVEPIHYLDRVQCYVGEDTLFGATVEEFNRLGIIGVQEHIPEFNPVDGLLNKNQLSVFAHQMFNEIGAIVKFNVKLPLATDDIIKRSQIFIHHNDQTKELVSYNKLGEDIEFNILCQTEGKYNVSLQFDSLHGLTYTTTTSFDVLDKGCSKISLYKIQAVEEDKNNKLSDKYNPFDRSSSRIDYNKSQYSVSTDGELNVLQSKHTQYIPAVEDVDKMYAPQLSHMLIFECPKDTLSINFKKLYDYLDKHYFITEKIYEWDLYGKQSIKDGELKETPIKYTICVAKYANTNYSPLKEAPAEVGTIFNNCFTTGIVNNKLIDITGKLKCREDFIFVPEYHKMIPLINDSDDKFNINNYCVDKYTLLCAVSDIDISKTTTNWAWRFTNQSDPNSTPIILKHFFKNPLIASNDPEFLSPGYYKVEFQYCLTNEHKINTIELDGAFIVK